MDTCTTFSLKGVTTTKVKKTITNMPSNKSPEHDKVNMRIIKTCLLYILPVVTGLINSSLLEGCFPKVWKLAEVVPHLKEGDHEVIAHEQFVHYLTTKNNKLSIHQSGNKRLHSPETLGVLFTSQLYKAIDELKVTAALLLDLSKAFDSIQHEVLLKKFHNLGGADDALKWFASYLTGRKQCTRVNNSLSNPLTVKHGVPQGSILGPLLFKLYINDLPTACAHCKVKSYVDDSKLYASFSNKGT